ncbi:hypothetical protein SAMN02910456_02018 [Ruminococcaceae bacterium YRB3002]|nr:hypothetical protein SAMN02910456_02018 [Ruminococcaceae bacterium YRB3002]
MSWPVVILYAVGTGVLAALFMIIPGFAKTSLGRMGETLEVWIFYAVILMANCKRPLESAFKTFVFFLISQPLIYLLQVPFSPLGWGTFSHYPYWFVWTLLTFPMAFAGWYIRKHNWLSLSIFLPILFLLTCDYVSGFMSAYVDFPHLIVTALFCLGQVVLYMYVFTENIWQKLIGVLWPLAAVLLLFFVFNVKKVVFMVDRELVETVIKGIASWLM